MIWTKILLQRVTSAELKELSLVDGQIAYNVETGESFLDVENPTDKQISRIQLSSGGDHAKLKNRNVKDAHKIEDIETLSDTLKNINEKISVIENAGFQAQIDNLKTTVSSLSDSLKTLESNVNTITNTTIPDINKKIEDLKTEINKKPNEGNGGSGGDGGLDPEFPQVPDGRGTY